MHIADVIFVMLLVRIFTLLLLSNTVESKLCFPTVFRSRSDDKTLGKRAVEKLIDFFDLTAAIFCPTMADI